MAFSPLNTLGYSLYSTLPSSPTQPRSSSSFFSQGTSTSDSAQDCVLSNCQNSALSNSVPPQSSTYNTPSSTSSPTLCQEISTHPVNSHGVFNSSNVSGRVHLEFSNHSEVPQQPNSQALLQQSNSQALLQQSNSQAFLQQPNSQAVLQQSSKAVLLDSIAPASKTLDIVPPSQNCTIPAPPLEHSTYCVFTSAPNFYSSLCPEAEKKETYTFPFNHYSSSTPSHNTIYKLADSSPYKLADSSPYKLADSSPFYNSFNGSLYNSSDHSIYNLLAGKPLPPQPCYYSARLNLLAEFLASNAEYFAKPRAPQVFRTFPAGIPSTAGSRSSYETASYLGRGYLKYLESGTRCCVLI